MHHFVSLPLLFLANYCYLLGIEKNVEKRKRKEEKTLKILKSLKFRKNPTKNLYFKNKIQKEEIFLKNIGFELKTQQGLKVYYFEMPLTF